MFWSYIAWFQLLWWFEQIWQRIFKLIEMPVLYLFLDKIAKFWHTARLSRTNRHKVISLKGLGLKNSLKNSPFFLAHPVYTLPMPGCWSVCPCPRGHFGIARSICLSVPRCCCLGYRHAGCLQLSHRWPSKLCRLRTRAFQFGQKKFWFDSILATESIFLIRFGNLINLPLVHWYSNSKLGVIL